MERAGIVLAILVAVCWGTADTVATFATRKLGTFTVTLISLVTSVGVLVLFAALTLPQLALTMPLLAQSASVGLLTGVMAAIGYFSLYRGLEQGPVAIVSPITAADGTVGAVLAILLLHEQVSLWQICLLIVIFLGIIVASTNLMEVHGILRASGITGLVKGGVRWGIVAMLTFGVMLFGIGLASQQWGWYVPIFWTRFFATLTLLLFALAQRLRFLRFPHASPDHASQMVRPAGKWFFTMGLAAIVGLVETVGLLVYSFDTQLVSTGIAAAISSSWGILPLVAGFTIFRERPSASQLSGVSLVFAGLLLLALKPA